jgi:imidazolonepropionase-like amidohydrolase
MMRISRAAASPRTMHRLQGAAAALLLSLLVGCGGARGAPAPAAADLAIRGVAVVDVENGTVQPDRTVLIRGNRIGAVLPTAEVRLAPGVRVVEGRGRYLIPGLWDMHVHTVDPAAFAQQVAVGVTGVRDMGGAAESVTDGCESIRPDSLHLWRSRIRTGEWVGPRMVLSGPAVSGTGWPTSLPARTEDEARAAVHRLVELGVDFVKVYEKVPLDAYLALARAARDAELPIAGHLPVESVTLPDAIHAGQRSIEHVRDPLLVCFTEDGGELLRFAADDGWSEDDVAWAIGAHALCPPALEALRSRETWLTPTLVVERSKVAVEEAAFVDDPRRATLPAPVREAFAAFVQRKRDQPAAERASEHLWWRTQRRTVHRVARAGAKLLAGTDAPCEGGLPGHSLHLELALLVEAGITPLQALRAATLEPARALGVADSLGTVAPGRVADLVLLEADPLRDIRNTSRIAAVILDGRLLERAALDALLEAVRPRAAARAR